MKWPFRSKISWLAGALVLAGSGAFVMPPLPSRLPESKTIQVTNVTALATDPTRLKEARWRHHFDLASLSDPSMPVNQPPAQNPATALKQWQLTGIILEDGVPFITVKKEQVWQVLHLTDRLEGFEFTNLEGRRVQFQKDGLIIELSLPDEPSG